MTSTSKKTIIDESRIIADLMKILTNSGYIVSESDMAYVNGFLAHIKMQQEQEKE